MVKLGIIILSALSLACHAQEGASLESYNSFGLERPEIKVQKIDLAPEYAGSSVSALDIGANHTQKASFDVSERYKKIITTSKEYPFLVSLQTSNPQFYKALQDTLRLEDSKNTQQKLDALIKIQQETNRLLVTLINKRSG